MTRRCLLQLVYVELFVIVAINSQFIEILPESINIGDDVHLMCQNSDVVTKNYVWYFNNKKVVDDKHFLQNSNELLIRNATIALSGYYSCVIEFVSSGAKIQTPNELIKIGQYVEYKPQRKSENIDTTCNFRIPKLCRNKRFKEEGESSFRFTPAPTSKNLEIGNSSKIHCRASGSNKIYWIKDDDDQLPENVEDANGTLIFENISLNHRGKYTCIASNENDMIIKTTIDIGLLPKFEVKPPEILEVVEYEPVFLDCSAPGSTIRWDFENKFITNDGEDSRFKIHDNGTLVLQEARLEDDGKYGCTIGNSAGFKREQTVLSIKSMDSHTSFEDTEKEDGFIMSKAVFMTCLVAFLYIAFVVALMIWCRYKRQKSRDSDDPENKEENDDTASDADEDKEPLNHEIMKPSRNKVHQHSENQKRITQSSTLIIDYLMIRQDALIDSKKIGRGEFGEVLAACIAETDLPSACSFRNNVHQHEANGTDVNEIHVQNRVNVLVKSMSSKLKDELHFVEFRRQIDMFRAVDCTNVAKLLALCFENDHHFMILEHGMELKSYLERSLEISKSKLLNFCFQISQGLDALAKSKLTHRDISLKNCILVNNSTVKLTSVALCKDKHANEYIKINNKLKPLRHSAPEVLETFNYSTASDVYSAAITFFEVLKRGKMPFETLTNDEYLRKFQSGSLDYASLVDDDEIPVSIRNTLTNCWSIQTRHRPDPEFLINLFDKIRNDTE